MKYLLAMLMFYAASASANMDQLMSKLNKELRPKEKGEVGLEVDYRVENHYGWVNIMVVKRHCDVEVKHYIEDGKIITLSEQTCNNYATDGKMNETLFQIHCERIAEDKSDEVRCANLFEQQLSVNLIRDIVKNKVNDSTIRSARCTKNSCQLRK